ncbi:MAG: GTP 3',8-cyclase MoaA [Pelistega sp.]|nr:GTP 3',8-cyclase MoaA [Pelistega sp.]
MLQDRFGRRIDYLRISVTDRCDLRCAYCIPEGFRGFEVPEAWLSFEEITRVVRAFANLGTSHFRLTGGEPLLRKNLSELVTQLRTIDGVKDLSLSTNGTRLAQHAESLRQAGVDRLNVSLDSLRGECIAEITGNGRSLAKVLEGLQKAKQAGYSKIKLNMVLLKDINEQDVMPMLEYCIENQFTLRLIETMPMGDTGRKMGYVSAQPIIQSLQAKYGLVAGQESVGVGPARYWQTPDGKFSLGLITPISQHFCETCNRVRLAVDGTLYMCLGQEERFELRPMLRAGCSDEELEQAIREAIELKPERHEFTEKPEKLIRFMSMTGG